MIDINLPSDIDANFVALIPDQHQQMNDLMEEEVIKSYTLSLDRSKLWIVINAKSKSTVVGIVNDFPLARYIKATIYELALHNTTAYTKFPGISLN